VVEVGGLAMSASTQLDDLQPDVINGPETIEERCFSAALICLEGNYTRSPPMGPATAAKVSSMISKTLEKTHTFKQVR
jgi:palmitoyltransferase